jgi:hypothetical protein
MNAVGKLSTKPTFEAVQKQFESWRKTRRHRSRIPEELWHAAISLCTNDKSISKISKALHLSQTKLKERVSASKAFALPESPSHPGFVELDLNHSTSLGQYVIEMEEKDGAKMRVHLKGEGGFDLLELIKAFWARTS